MHAAAAMREDWRHEAADLYRRLVAERAGGYDAAAELTEQEMNEVLERGFRQLRRRKAG